MKAKEDLVRERIESLFDRQAFDKNLSDACCCVVKIDVKYVEIASKKRKMIAILRFP